MRFSKKTQKKEGVVVLPSGVQYMVIKDGTGRQPTLNDNVTIRYRLSRVTDPDMSLGTPDSPAKTYPLQKTLPGLREVLQLMKEGSVWQVILPPGRTTMGSPGEALERGSVLVYQLELMSVEPGG